MTVLIPLTVFILFCLLLVLGLCHGAKAGDRMLAESRAEIQERAAARDLRTQRTVQGVASRTRWEDR